MRVTSFDIKNYLHGDKDSLATYRYVMDQMYGNCEKLIQETYRHEQRWPTHTFWARRVG